MAVVTRGQGEQWKGLEVPRRYRDYVQTLQSLGKTRVGGVTRPKIISS